MSVLVPTSTYAKSMERAYSVLSCNLRSLKSTKATEADIQSLLSHNPKEDRLSTVVERTYYRSRIAPAIMDNGDPLFSQAMSSEFGVAFPPVKPSSEVPSKTIVMGYMVATEDGRDSDEEEGNNDSGTDALAMGFVEVTNDPATSMSVCRIFTKGDPREHQELEAWLRQYGSTIWWDESGGSRKPAGVDVQIPVMVLSPLGIGAIEAPSNYKPKTQFRLRRPTTLDRQSIDWRDDASSAAEVVNAATAADQAADRAEPDDQDAWEEL